LIVSSYNKRDLLGKEMESEQAEKFNLSLKKFAFSKKVSDFRIIIKIDYK